MAVSPFSGRFFISNFNFSKSTWAYLSVIFVLQWPSNPDSLKRDVWEDSPRKTKQQVKFTKNCKIRTYYPYIHIYQRLSIFCFLLRSLQKNHAWIRASLPRLGTAQRSCGITLRFKRFEFVSDFVPSDSFWLGLYYNLYPILRRNCLRFWTSFSVSTPLGLYPSMTPIMPRPCSVSATMTCTGFAVAQ